MIHLDANFLVDVIRSGPSRDRLRRWGASHQYVSISSVAWSEFLCGPVSTAETLFARSLLDAIELFDEHDAELAADLFNQTGRRTRSLPDCMIAAVAIRRAASLATFDEADFRKFHASGLVLS